MKLPLRYFILVCVLLGAIGVPWAWRAYQARQAAEIERLHEIERVKNELSAVWLEVESLVLQPDGTYKPDVSPEYKEWHRRRARLKARFEELTGVPYAEPQDAEPQDADPQGDDAPPADERP